ncbi:hypothetical protein ACLOJK_036757, partial [Asimina triloba]
MQDDEHQHHLALKAVNHLVEECVAKATIISAPKARMAKIDVELPSPRKLAKEREEIMIRDSSRLREVEPPRRRGSRYRGQKSHLNQIPLINTLGGCHA